MSFAGIRRAGGAAAGKAAIIDPIEEEAARVVREAARAGHSLNAYREAERLLALYPCKYTVDEVAEMLVRASTRVAGSSIELGVPHRRQPDGEDKG